MNVVVSLSLPLLVSLLGISSAVAPGDEDKQCDRPLYSDVIQVLLDTWRYQQPIPPVEANRDTMWYNTGGQCWSSVLSVCAGGQALHLHDIVIPDAEDRGNPMMVLVNITYSFESCFGLDCNSTIELSLIRLNANGKPYVDNEAIMPSNKIVLKPHSSIVGLRHLYFLAGRRFSLILTSLFMNKCFMTSRVLVYQGITFSPGEEQYIFREGSKEQVCFTCTGAGTEAEIITNDGTAIRTFDYGPVNESVVFKSGESHCISIEIASDGLAEREEDFTVILLVGGVMISSVTVIIASNGADFTMCTEGSVTAVSDIEGNYPNLVQTCGERGDWFPLCDSEWTLQDANVVCRELEYSYVEAMEVIDGPHCFNRNGLVCSGAETNLSSCFSEQPFQNNTLSYLLIHCKNHTSTPFSSSATESGRDDSSDAPSESQQLTLLLVGIIMAIVIAVFLVIIICMRRKMKTSRVCPKYSDGGSQHMEINRNSATPVDSPTEMVNNDESSGERVEMEGNPIYTLNALDQGHPITTNDNDVIYELVV